MSHTFEVKHLANDRALITGTDDQNTIHQVVVSSSGFHQIEDYFADQERAAAYDAAIEEFYAPLVAAAAAYDKAAPVVDPAWTFVIDEGVAATEGRMGTVVELDRDTVILRLIAEGSDRLIWVGDTIEILAYEPPVPEESVGQVEFDPAEYSGQTDLPPEPTLF